MQSELRIRYVYSVGTGIWLLFTFIIESTQESVSALRVRSLVPEAGKRYVLAGTSIVLSCVSGQSHNSPLQWSFNGETLKSDHDMLSITSTQTTTGLTTSELYWECVTEEQGGLYTCQDRAGNSQTLNITVISLIPSPGYLSLTKERLEPITIGCRVSSKLTPYQYKPIKWYFKDQPIKASHGWHQGKYHTFDQNNTLVIKYAEEADAGDYTCTLRLNEVNETLRQTVSVYVLPLVESFESEEIRVTEGDGMTLQCRIRGDGIQHVKWLKGNSSLTVDGRVELGAFRSYQNASLHVKTVAMNDSGSYFCYVENSYGASSTRSINVVVLDWYAAVWVFLGIVAEVFLLAIIANIYDRYLTRELKKNEREQEKLVLGKSLANTEQGSAKA